ncbi:MAG: PAC2 family protein [Desulfobacterales bacterium]|nr:PAC2 family protein [Desulfobacterales bacterium]
MAEDLVTYYQAPPLHNPVLIAGFGGWSNGGNIALKSIEYIIRKKGATVIARVDPDHFYQFTQNRPVITVKEGRLQDLNLKKISFYFCPNREGEHDLILLKAQEPDYRWPTFVQILFHLFKQWGVSLIISIGGMYDDVLHTEAIVSGVYSCEEWKEVFIKNDVHLIEYEGPSGIHSLIMQRAEKESYPFIGLWGHSPLYLRGTNFRVVVRIISLIASFIDFSIDTLELESSLKQFDHQIGEILEKNSELREHIEEIKKIRGGEARKKDTPKIINIKDFFRPKDS